MALDSQARGAILLWTVVVPSLFFATGIMTFAFCALMGWV